MDIIELFKNEYLSILFGGLAGVLTAWVTQRVINKRGIFSYHVNHSRAGISTEDKTFGNVEVTWNKNPIQHLYFSTLELKNESLNDYENVIINTYTNNTTLLSESNQILDTPNILKWTDEFKKQLKVESGEKPTDNQLEIYYTQREYLIPVFNRGQVIRINYLNSAKTDEIPCIWLTATIKGVKVKFRIPQPIVHGVEQSKASIAGVIIGLILLFPLVKYIDQTLLVAILAITYGLFAQIPGAFFIKLLRKLREFIGG